MKFILIGLLTVLLTSCAITPTPRFSGSGNLDDLLNARYQCVSELPVDVYGNPSCASFSSCLRSKGWTKVVEGGVEVPMDYVVSCH